MPDLTSADLDLAFTFSRSESGSYRDANGTVQVAAPDVPRFDHDLGGTPRGLLVTSGIELGGHDRLALDPLILPAELTGAAEGGRRCTVLHCFDKGDGPEYRAWYSRDAEATVNALMAQAGNHLTIGVVPGFREPEFDAGRMFVRFRNRQWDLPPLVGTGAGVLAAAPGKPLIAAGAEQV